MWAPQLRAIPLQKVNLRAVLMRGDSACRDYWWALLPCATLHRMLTAPYLCSACLLPPTLPTSGAHQQVSGLTLIKVQLVM